MDIALEQAPCQSKLHPWEILFSESGSRFLASVSPEHLSMVADVLTQTSVPWATLGRIVPEQELLISHHKQPVIHITIGELRRRYKGTLNVF